MSLTALSRSILPFLCCLLVAVGARAQVLDAFDDEFFVPQGQTCVVEFPGVLDNDVLDEENAFEMGAVAELVTDAALGTLVLAADGSFTYDAGPGFDGRDTFTYRAVFGAVTAEAVVVLSACEGGPDVYACWNESEYLRKAAELGLHSFTEGFEDDAAWGAARSPYDQSAVVSQGVRWTSNHWYDPAWNVLTTGNGAARSGQGGLFDFEHGYATGTTGQCDIDDPPAHCLFNDGWSGTREPGGPVLHGVGGWVRGIYGATVVIILDGGAPLGGWRTFDFNFMGVIDSRPGGFQSFRFEETDGKVGQAFYVWADDFTFLTDAPVTAVEPGEDPATMVSFAGAVPNPSGGSTVFHFSLREPGDVVLGVYEQRGRLVRRLERSGLDAGVHSLAWDGRDGAGWAAAEGVYLARLEMGSRSVARKMVIAR